MTDTDAAEFSAALLRAAEVFGEACSPGRVMAYFDSLADLPIAWVLDGLAETEKQSRWFPKPVEIRERAQRRDGHLDPEEAWALVATLGEDDSVVWTDQIALAYGVAIGVGRDRVGARMAFLERYRRELEAVRSRCEPARWWPSLGYSVNGRIQPVLEAQAMGRLTSSQVECLIPPELTISPPILALVAKASSDGERKETA